MIGYARDGDDAVGVLLRIRDGRVIGREHRFLENVEEVPDAEVLERPPGALLPARRGAGRPPGASVPPGRPRGAARRSLPGVDGAACRSAAPPHAGSSWPTRTPGTCSRAFGSSPSRRRSGPRIRSTPSAAISACSVVPRSLICVDISTNQGRDTVGSLVWFEAGRPQEGGVPEVPDPGRRPAGRLRRHPRGGDALPHAPAGGRQAAAGPRGHRRRQGPARRGARRARTPSGCAELPIVTLAKREEEVFLPGRPDEPAAPAPRAVAAAAPARARRGAPVRRGLQPQAAERADHHVGAARHSAASVRSSGPGSSNGSGVSPPSRRPAPPKSPRVPGFSTTLAERVLATLRSRT